jgi:hypothetical protein
MDGREVYRILAECWKEKKKDKEREGEVPTTKGTGMPVKKWKD